MKKYAKVINEETKACEVGLGTNSAFYQSIGMTEMEVEQAYDGSWYVFGFTPIKPEPTFEEIRQTRQETYKVDVDPITCHIQRLNDEEQTAAIIAEIATLVEERKAKVAEIKARYPYPAVEEPLAESEPVVEEPVVELYSMEI